MLLLGININSGRRPRGYPLRMWQRMAAYFNKMRCSVVQRMATYGNVVRCMATYCIVVLAGCSSCAHQQPIGVLCSGMSEGTGFSKGMSEGPASMSQSQAIKYSRVICKLYYSESELDRAIDSHVKQ